MTRPTPGAGTFYEGDEDSPASPAAEPERYARQGLLGAGGMGQVHAAYDSALGRVVALKEARADAGPEVAARLEREARMTAALDHPGIVTVHDAGQGPDGRPWYTMRLVRGQSLGERFDATPPGPDRLQLVRHVLDASQAVAWAHAHGTVHRDLKPDNIMVGEMGETQVVDWGLAVPTGANPGIAGTPDYMSPEQARGQPADPRDDVFAFGAVLYELLSGHRPRGDSTATTGVGRALLPIPPLPAGLPPELAAITQKCLSMDPAARYPSARELAADLTRWLDGRPVEAHRYSAGELLVRAYRAWRAPILVAGVALVAFIGTLAYTTWRTSVQRDRATAAEADARGALATALAAHARTAFGLGAWPEAEVLATAALADHEAPDARGVLAGIAALRRPTLLTEETVPTCLRAKLGWEPKTVVCDSADGVSLWQLAPLVERWRAPDGAALDVQSGGVVVQSADGARRRVLDLRDGHVRSELPQTNILWKGRGEWVLGGGRSSALFAFSADGTQKVNVPRCAGNLAEARVVADDLVLSVCDSGEVLLAGLDGAVRARFPDVAPFIGPAAWLPTRGAIAVLDRDSALWLLPLAGAPRKLTTLTLGTVVTLLPNPTERFVVVVGSKGGTELWDLDTASRAVRLPLNESRDADLTPEGNLIELGTRWRSWALPAALAPAAVPLPGGASAVAFAPDGGELTVGLGSGDMVRWSVSAGRTLDAWHACDVAVKGIAYGAGDLVYTANENGLRRRTTQGVDTRIVATNFLRRMSLFPGGPYIGVGNTDQLRVLTEGARVDVAAGIGELQELGTSPRQAAMVVVGTGGQVRILRPGAPVTLGEILPDTNAITATINDAATIVYTGGPDGVRAWRAGALLWTAPHPNPYPVDLALSGDERWLAAAGLDGGVRVYRAQDGALTAVLRGHDARLSALAFATERPLLATVGWDARLRVWDLSALDLDAATAAERARTWWHMSAAEALAAVGR